MRIILIISALVALIATATDGFVPYRSTIRGPTRIIVPKYVGPDAWLSPRVQMSGSTFSFGTNFASTSYDPDPTNPGVIFVGGNQKIEYGPNVLFGHNLLAGNLGIYGPQNIVSGQTLIDNEHIGASVSSLDTLPLQLGITSGGTTHAVATLEDINGPASMFFNVVFPTIMTAEYYLTNPELPVKMVTGEDGSTVTLSCSGGDVVGYIMYAAYVATDLAANPTCGLNVVKSEVIVSCADGTQKDCSIPVSSSDLGVTDPCPGEEKALTVYYSCGAPPPSAKLQQAHKKHFA